MRVFVLRAVLMLTLTILLVSAMSAGLAMQAPGAGSDVAYMVIVTTVSSALLAVALGLTHALRDPIKQPSTPRDERIDL